MSAIYLSSLLTVLSVFAINIYIKKGDLLFPPVLHSGLWLMVLILYYITHSYFITPNDSVFFLIAISCVLFSASAIIASGSGIRDREANSKNEFFRIVSNNSGSLLLLSVAILFIISRRSLEIIGNYDLASAYFALRNAINYGEAEDGYGVIRYFFTINNFILFSITLTVANCPGAVPRFRLYLFILISLMAAIISTSRTQLFMTFILAILPAYYYGKIKLKAIVIMLAAILVPTALLMALALGKMPDNILETFAIYTVSPLIALSTQLEILSPNSGGEHTFRFFHALFAALGYENQARPLVQNFVNVPFETNIYTSFYPYYLDYGISGVLAFQVLLGLFHGFLYRRVSNGSRKLINSSIFMISLLPLSTVYSTETHFLQLSLWLQFGIMSYIGIFIIPKMKFS